MSLISTILGNLKDNINKVELITENISTNFSVSQSENGEEQKLQNLLTAQKIEKTQLIDQETIDLAETTVDLILAQRNIAANIFTIKIDNEAQKFLFTVH